MKEELRELEVLIIIMDQEGVISKQTDIKQIEDNFKEIEDG